MGLRIDRGGGGTRGPRPSRPVAAPRLGQVSSGPTGIPQLRTPTAGFALLAAAAQSLQGLTGAALAQRSQQVQEESARIGLELANEARRTGRLPELPSSQTLADRTVREAYESASVNFLTADVAAAANAAGMEFDNLLEQGDPAGAMESLQDARREAERLPDALPDDLAEQFRVDIDVRFSLLEERANQAILRQATGTALVQQQQYARSVITDFRALSVSATSLSEGATAASAAIEKLTTANEQAKNLPFLTEKQKLEMDVLLLNTIKGINEQAVKDEYGRQVDVLLVQQPGETAEEADLRVRDQSATLVNELLEKQTLIPEEDKDAIRAQLRAIGNQDAAVFAQTLAEENAQEQVGKAQEAFRILSGRNKEEIVAGVGKFYGQSQARTRLAQIDSLEKKERDTAAQIAAVEASLGNGYLDIPQNDVNLVYDPLAGTPRGERMLVGMIRAGRMPDLEKRSLNSAILSRDPQAQAVGYTRATALMQENRPVTWDALSPEAKTVYDVVTEGVSVDRLSIEQAVENAAGIGQMTPKRQAEVAALVGSVNDPRWRDNPRLVDAWRFLRDQDGFNKKNIEAQPGVLVDWLDTVRREALLLPESVPLTDDTMEQLFDRSWRKFQRVRGEHWDGRLFFTPEIAYPNIPADFQQAEVIQNLHDLVNISKTEAGFFTGIGIEFPEGSIERDSAERARAVFDSLSVDIDDVIENQRFRLLEDDETRTGERPTWALQVQDVSGAWTFIPRPDMGENMRWFPNGEAFYIEREEALTAELEDAVKERRRFLEQQKVQAGVEAQEIIPLTGF